MYNMGVSVGGLNGPASLKWPLRELQFMLPLLYLHLPTQFSAMWGTDHIVYMHLFF